jgi:uncharacterized YigZ family protein
MFRLAGIETSEQEIKKSRFIAIAGPVADEHAAKAFIAVHSDATANHNCWAWRIGQAYRFTDAGEPSGTAGKPILQAIDGQALDHVAVVVIRWFGGILLGSGGLIRAYGGTAALCLRAAEKVEFVAEVTATLQCGFSDLALVKARLIARPGLRIAGETFGADGAELTLVLPEADAEDVARMVADITSGRSVVRFAD